MDQTPQEPEKPSPAGEGKPGRTLPTRRTFDPGRPVGGLQIGLQIGGRRSTGRQKDTDTADDPEKVIRLEQEEPRTSVTPRQVIPKIEKIEVVSPRRQRGEGSDWGKARPQSARWIIAAAVAIILLIIGAVAIHPWLSRSSLPVSNKPRVVPLEPIQPLDGTAIAKFGGFDLTGASEVEAIALLTKYAGASSVEEVIPLVRGGGAMEHVLRKHWKSWGAGPSWQPHMNGGLRVTDTGTFSYAVLLGQRPDFSPFVAYFVIEDGRLVIDWAATETHGDLDFEQLREGEASGGTVRVWIEETDYFTLSLPESDFRSFRLTSPNWEDAVWGYVRRGGAFEENLDRYFKSGAILQAPSGIQRATLVLEKAHEGTLPNQWMIREILHNDWTTP